MAAESTVGRYTLYRFYDGEGNLLYIGQTAGIAVRLVSHRWLKDWWTSVTRIDVEHFQDKASAIAAERAAIKLEKPRYNVHHGRAKEARLVNGRIYSERHERRLRRGR